MSKELSSTISTIHRFRREIVIDARPYIRKGQEYVRLWYSPQPLEILPHMTDTSGRQEPK